MANPVIPRGPTQALRWGRKLLSETGPWAELGTMFFGACEIAARHLKSMCEGISEFAKSLTPSSSADAGSASTGEDAS